MGIEEDVGTYVVMAFVSWTVFCFLTIRISTWIEQRTIKRDIDRDIDREFLEQYRRDYDKNQ
jgi:hypothetical protein